MNLRKKFYIVLFGGFALCFAFFYFGNKFMKNAISNFTNGKMDGIGSFMGLSNAPVFQTGIFSEDGNYFVYTYQPEIEKPNVKGSVTIRGFAYPPYFQIIDCRTGKKVLDGAFESEKYSQLYVVWEQDDLVWLSKTLESETTLALYDIKANKFRYKFGDLEKLNPNVNWKSNYSYFVNTTAKKGLLLEANDKRYYRIDPNSGKAEVVQDNLKMVNYNFAKDFQVSDNNGDRQYNKRQINGNRTSITGDNGKTISQDDFIDVKFLTLTKNKTIDGYSDAPVTYYKNNFFVLSPIASDNEVDMELTMIDKSNLNTIWKLQLPQKKLKTIIPKYEMERFYIKGDQMLVSNNDYLMTIDLTNGKIVNQENLYD